MMTKEVSIKIVNFMVPGAEFFVPGGGWPNKSYVKMHISYTLLFYSGAWIKQIKYVIVMTKEGSIKSCKFNGPWDRVYCSRMGGTRGVLPDLSD